MRDWRSGSAAPLHGDGRGFKSLIPYLNNSMINFYKFFTERAFHGTPNEVVGDFSLNKIGTGEGSQVFGWGLYFADSQKVAQSYKNPNPYSNKRTVKYKGKTPEEWERESDYVLGYVWEKIKLNVTKDELLTYGLSKAQMDLVNSLPDEIFHKGNLYEVDIDASDDDFIHYDERVYENDTVMKKINDGIKKIYNYDEGRFFQGNQDGNTFYNEVCKYISEFENKLEQFGNDPTVNEQKLGTSFLARVGVKGIKYLDQHSRGGQGETYNYVIFDPSVIKIVKKNGEYVMDSKKPTSVDVSPEGN